MRRSLLALSFFFFSSSLYSQTTLRGEIAIELEPIYGLYVEDKYPIDKDEAYRRALEEAALYFSAQVYGWSFDYEVGEKARAIPEKMDLEPEGKVEWGDPKLRVTQAEFRQRILHTWMDYRPAMIQERRLAGWKSGTIRKAQAVGFGGFGGADKVRSWYDIKKAALEDAARAAVRGMLRGSERNRPKRAKGFIALESFPRFFMDSGRWACSARFYVDIKELIPFSAY
jgi:hypothetical protein